MTRPLITFLGAALAAALIPTDCRAEEPMPILFRAGAFECAKTLPDSQTTNLVTDVEQHYKAISDLSAVFLQSSYFVGSDEQRVSRGKVSFKRPGMMDWVYERPESQRFISNGKSVWWHQPTENQVTLRNFRESFSSDVPVSFLLGVGKLRENFKLSSACSTSDGSLLKLQPLKASANLNEFFLLVDSKDHSPIGARIFDVAGNETSILFEGTKLNTGVPESQFAFEIPKGTYVVDERQLDADGASGGKP